MQRSGVEEGEVLEDITLLVSAQVSARRTGCSRGTVGRLWGQFWNFSGELFLKVLDICGTGDVRHKRRLVPDQAMTNPGIHMSAVKVKPEK